MLQYVHFPEEIPTRNLDQGPAYPWYPAANLNSSTPQATLGAFWELTGPTIVGGGQAFQYLRAEGAIPARSLVKRAAPIEFTVAASGSDVFAVVATSANPTAGAVAVKPAEGDLIYCAPTGGTPWIRTIKAVDVTNKTYYVARRDFQLTGGVDQYGASPTLGGPADTDQLASADVPTSGDKFWILRPWAVQACVTGDRPCGLAMAAVTSTYYAPFLVRGIGLCDVDGTTNVAHGEYLKPDTSLQTITNTSTNPGFIVVNVGPAWTTDATKLALPVYVNLVDQL